MIDSVDAILPSRGHEVKPHFHINEMDGEHGAFKNKAGRARDIDRARRERLKGFNCLREILRLVESHGNSLEPILQGIVDLLPASWQHSDVCCARLTIHGEDHATKNYRQTVWKQSATIYVNGIPAGVVEVYYLREMPECDEGPFLEEECDLIDAVAQMAGNIVEGVSVRCELEVQRLESNERLKELNCLYGISQLVDRYGNDLDKILQGIANLSRLSWQYPEVCCAKLTLQNKSYSTDNFCKTNRRQSSEIHVGDELVGSIEICYLAQRPDHDEGPFLREERCLIDAIAERTGKITERIQNAGRLEADRASLKEMNVALRKVVNEVEEEKEAIRQSIRESVDKIIMPTLHSLANQVSQHHEKSVEQLQRDLQSITSPFASRLSAEFASLTPVEIRICKMIRNGLSTNEIAQLRYVSPSTVTKQREQIRRKLQLQGTGTNLVSYLLTLDTEKSIAIGR